MVVSDRHGQPGDGFGSAHRKVVALPWWPWSVVHFCVTDTVALTTPMSSVPDTNAIARIKNMAQLTEIRNRACMTSLGRVRRRWPDVHSTQVPLRAFVRAPRSKTNSVEFCSFLLCSILFCFVDWLENLLCEVVEGSTTPPVTSPFTHHLW